MEMESATSELPQGLLRLLEGHHVEDWEAAGGAAGAVSVRLHLQARRRGDSGKSGPTLRTHEDQVKGACMYGEFVSIYGCLMHT